MRRDLDSFQGHPADLDAGLAAVLDDLVQLPGGKDIGSAVKVKRASLLEKLYSLHERERAMLGGQPETRTVEVPKYLL